MTVPISKGDLVAVWGLGEVNRWAKKPSDPEAIDNSETNIATALANGWSEVRSAAINRFSADSVDLVTSETIPSIVKGYAVDLATEWLSRGNDRQAAVETAAEKARSWLALLVTGRDHSFDEILVLLSSPTGTVSARVGSPRSLLFDSDDPRGGLRRRVTGI